MRFGSGKHADIKHSTMFALECLLLPFVLFEVFFQKTRTGAAEELCIHVCIFTKTVP
jgi:hypothetical protein